MSHANGSHFTGLENPIEIFTYTTVARIKLAALFTFTTAAARAVEVVARLEFRPARVVKSEDSVLSWLAKVDRSDPNCATSDARADSVDAIELAELARLLALEERLEALEPMLEFKEANVLRSEERVERYPFSVDRYPLKVLRSDMKFV